VIPTFYTAHARTSHANSIDHEARAVFVRKHNNNEDL
jgi:hypothetical protein